MCLSCGVVYRENPFEEYETGHNARPLEICKCGCDLFITIDEKIDFSRNNVCEIQQVYF